MITRRVGQRAGQDHKSAKSCPEAFSLLICGVGAVSSRAGDFGFLSKGLTEFSDRFLSINCLN
jgi:hypothetical protein